MSREPANGIIIHSLMHEKRTQKTGTTKADSATAAPASAGLSELSPANNFVQIERNERVRSGLLIARNLGIDRLQEIADLQSGSLPDEVGMATMLTFDGGESLIIRQDYDNGRFNFEILRVDGSKQFHSHSVQEFKDIQAESPLTFPSEILAEIKNKLESLGSREVAEAYFESLRATWSEHGMLLERGDYSALDGDETEKLKNFITRSLAVDILSQKLPELLADRFETPTSVLQDELLFLRLNPAGVSQGILQTSKWQSLNKSFTLNFIRRETIVQEITDRATTMHTYSTHWLENEGVAWVTARFLLIPEESK